MWSIFIKYSGFNPGFQMWGDCVTAGRLHKKIRYCYMHDMLMQLILLLIGLIGAQGAPTRSLVIFIDDFGPPVYPNNGEGKHMSDRQFVVHCIVISQ